VGFVADRESGRVMTVTAERTDFTVRITFDNGVFKARANTTSRQRAYELALTDARMGNPFEVYDGPVRSWEAVPAVVEQQEREPWSRRRYP